MSQKLLISQKTKAQDCFNLFNWNVWYILVLSAQSWETHSSSSENSETLTWESDRPQLQIPLTGSEHFLCNTVQMPAESF